MVMIIKVWHQYCQLTMQNSKMVEQVLGAYLERDYSSSFRKMMSKALDKIHKKRTIEQSLLSHWEREKEYRNMLPPHQSSLHIPRDSGKLRPSPVQVTALQPSQQTPRYSHQKRPNIKLLESLSRQQAEELTPSRIKGRTKFRRGRYGSFEKSNTKSVDELISDINHVLKKPLPHRTKTIESSPEESSAPSRVRKCKIERREQQKKSLQVFKWESRRRKQEGCQQWEPWETEVQEAEI